MVRLVWTELSISDLKDIFDYICRDSVLYAKRQVLKTNQSAGRILPELEQSEIRELIEGHYRIIYKIIDNNKVAILTIHHTSRDLDSRVKKIFDS